jgi:hypothetical protein
MKKKIRKFFRRFTKREFLFKLLIIVSSLALIGTSVLPYFAR